MARSKKSFFERLTGSVNVDDDATFEEPEIKAPAPETPKPSDDREEWMEEENNEGQLTVDVYQTADSIIIKAIVAGVRPDDLDVSITRDMITIRGKRKEHKEVTEDNYYYKELYWGTFSRTILLPQEIDVDSADAKEKHGILTLILPKIDKDKQTRVKVKAH
jgi:HSP20 family protein|tara:strand:+ start:6618 stop:7103 length:486 start_codon:yes stop_codon:yes gene_type:complete